ncbi:DUF3047 domain-containing protein [Falsiroseomonas tokyonensis]|uniref:DUF3047 domain-containing protein n=1 Tax=Falsiroseomonas tokyonensis TaxID=430521 RepID=A0ABV7BZZ9_9PROT|nr:DUF3047 domain-containing protein [Falsiroseomonas tokyonensis]MBU8541119.1 DUF3047 domain-containing protein [Falsiroseomonas tokyonensis]
MKRLALALGLACAAPLLAAAIAPGRTAPELERLGWRKVLWQGIPPARFEATPTGGVRLLGSGEAAFLYRTLSGPATCLAWRWRVDAGPPATDLTRKGGDDRAVSLTVGFSDYGPNAGIAARAQMAVAQAVAGDHRLPRSTLSYVWGGTGQEGAGRFFASPYGPAISRVRILRPASTPQGRWVEERVDLGADWRAAFGGANVPPLQEVAISTDVDDTGSRIDAQVEDIRLVPC